MKQQSFEIFRFGLRNNGQIHVNGPAWTNYTLVLIYVEYVHKLLISKVVEAGKDPKHKCTSL